MRAIRLAGPAAILWVVGLCTSRAARLDAASPRALDVPRLSLGHGRRRSLFAALLLGAAVSPVRAGRVEEVLEGGPHFDPFVSLDVDRDRRLTRQEYEAVLEGADEATKLHHLAMFHEADVDGDDVLSLQEYVFSRFLITESASQKALEMAASRLPEGFAEGIDDTFLDLRARFSGKVGCKQVARALWKFLGISDSVTETAWGRLQLMCQVADIIPDGVLNVNELDFLHFMVREDLVAGALKSGSPAEMDVDALAKQCDANGDGLIDEAEVFGVFAEAFGPLLVEEKPFKDRIAKAFLVADVNGDGGIDSEEAPEFFEAIGIPM